MLSESHSSFHIELHQTFFDKTDGQLFCRGNNGCWRWGGPSARYNPPLPWALRQVWEHRAKLNSLCTQILTFCEKKQINKKRVLKTIFFKPRSIHTVVEGPVLWFRKNVVEAARSGEVSWFFAFFVLSNDPVLIFCFIKWHFVDDFFPATCVVSPPVPESYIHRGLWCFWHDLQVKSIIQIQIINITCYLDLIRFEANQQFLRDWMVEAEMLGLLRLVLLCLPCKTRFNPKIEVLILWP